MRLANLVAISLLCAFAPARAQSSHPPEWSRPAEPFRILGNVHYVGTEGIASFLVTSRAGHVLIDGGLPENAKLIAANIRKLGFRLRDVKYLLINHAHYDHSGGLAELKRLTGAKLVASNADAADLQSGANATRPELPGFPKVAVDRRIGDGAMLVLGTLRLTAHLTPGHTKGCTSWKMETAGRTVLFACSVTVAGQKLVHNQSYPEAASDFRSSFAKLRATKADVYLTFHAEMYDQAEKRRRQLAGDANAFVDPGELPRRVQAAERAFEAELERQSRQ